MANFQEQYHLGKWNLVSFGELFGNKMNTLNIDLVLLSGLTIALMEAIKIALKGKLNNYLPLMSIGIGIVIALFLTLQYGWVSAIVTGAVIGSSAAGLYDLKGLLKK